MPTPEDVLREAVANHRDFAPTRLIGKKPLEDQVADLTHRVAALELHMQVVTAAWMKIANHKVE